MSRLKSGSELTVTGKDDWACYEQQMVFGTINLPDCEGSWRAFLQCFSLWTERWQERTEWRLSNGLMSVWIGDQERQDEAQCRRTRTPYVTLTALAKTKTSSSASYKSRTCGSGTRLSKCVAKTSGQIRQHGTISGRKVPHLTVSPCVFFTFDDTDSQSRLNTNGLLPLLWLNAGGIHNRAQVS